MNKTNPHQLSLFAKNDTSKKAEELEESYFEEFAWAVPLAFADPLALCRFEEGDTLYDTKKAYFSPWAEALKHVKFGIQVTFPHKAVQKKIAEEEDSVFESNWSYPLELDLLEFMNNKFKKKTHIKTTQGVLYTFLWKGDFEIFKSTAHPPAPFKSKFLKATLELSGKKFIQKIWKEHDFTEAFIMPYDKSSSLLTGKLTVIRENLKNDGISTTTLYGKPISILGQEHTPGKQDNLFNKEFAPTLQLICLMTSAGSYSTLFETIKKAVYKPSKNRKSNVDLFKINAHGILLKREHPDDTYR